MVLMAQQQQLGFDASRLSCRTDIPQQFIWPEDESPTPDAAEELHVPLIDLSGDPGEVVRQVGAACELRGFFQVVNHGIDQELLAEAHRCMDTFFTLPLPEKHRAQRLQGESCGYASSFTGRFASKLPWKETLSFRSSSTFRGGGCVVDYFVEKLGEEQRHHGYDIYIYIVTIYIYILLYQLYIYSKY
jgi:gibberellin-44 dioxygenase